jgi:glycosyltransferase involved in cell wall biosynthesis
MSFNDSIQPLPKISIITVVYNGSGLIEKTIKSILSQTYKKIEYIIIDGASTDGTLDIIKKYEKSIKRWISEPDNGLYYAMNKGIDLATGEYLWFINAGDEIFDKETICQIFDSKQGYLKDIYYGETLIIDKNGKEIGMRRQKSPAHLTWKSLKIGMVVSHQSFIVNRKIATYFDLRYKCSADIDWMIKTLKAAGSIENTHLILSKFLDGGRSKSTIITSLRERFEIMTSNYGLVSTLLNHIRIAFRFLLFYIKYRRF